MTVERDWFWFWFYYALLLASVFTLVLVLRQSSENRSNLTAFPPIYCTRKPTVKKVKIIYRVFHSANFLTGDRFLLLFNPETDIIEKNELVMFLLYVDWG